MYFIRLCLFSLILIPFLSSQISAQSCPGKRSFVRTKVIGGDPASIRHWPGLATLRLLQKEQNEVRYQCGAMRIAPNWVITAAHCFDYLKKQNNGSYTKLGGWKLEIVRGRNNLKDIIPEDVAQIDKVIIHPQYIRQQAPQYGHDIALIKLKKSWSGETVPLALNISPENLNANVRVAGYGATSVNENKDAIRRFRDKTRAIFWSGSDRLMDVVVPLVPTPQCKARYREYAVGPGQICGGFKSGGKDACQGDSGGPMIAYDNNGCPFQIGIVSWGLGCAEAGNYGVYTKVDHYADWIRSHVPQANNVKKQTQRLKKNKDTRRKFFSRTVIQLQDIITRKHILRLSIPGGETVKLGREIAFEAKSSIPGNLIIIDINANGKVTQIFPNRFVSEKALWSIKADSQVLIPNEAQYGLKAFRAVEPTGKGTLLGLVVPLDFPITSIEVGQDIEAKGFAPVARQSTYLQELVQQINNYLKNNANPKWAITTIEYEINR